MSNAGRARERIEQTIWRLFTNALVALLTAWLVMLGLGALHGTWPIFPAWGYWTCFVVQLAMNAVVELLYMAIERLGRKR